MKKLNPSLFLAAAIALCANSALAQGTMLYTWHDSEGPHSLFQASFQIYDFEQTPGTWFSGTHLFDQTITVTSPDHTWSAGTGGGYASGYRPDLYLDAVFSARVFPDAEVDVSSSSIREYAMSGGLITGTRFSETGFWTFAPVPEPSAIALLAIGLLALANKNGIASGNGLVLTPATVTTSLL